MHDVWLVSLFQFLVSFWYVQGFLKIDIKFKGFSRPGWTIFFQIQTGLNYPYSLTLCKPSKTVKTQMKCSILFVKVKKIFRQNNMFLFFFLIITGHPLICTMDHSKYIISYQVEEPIRIQRVNTWLSGEMGKERVLGTQGEFKLILKTPITTAADNKFCDILPNFRKK